MKVNFARFPGFAPRCSDHDMLIWLVFTPATKAMRMRINTALKPGRTLPEAKSLLLQLEDENAELRLSEQRLNDEIHALNRQLLERDKALAQLTKDWNANPHADRGRDTADTAVSAERNRVKELAKRNAELETSVKTLEEQLRLQGKALGKAEAAAEEQQRAREETARFAAEAHETLREKDAGARSAARSATKFAQSLVALESKVAAHDQEMDQRAAEWLQERARLQAELRKAHDENKQLRKADDSQRARAARLQERLDVLTQSLRSHPPSAHSGVGLSGRVAVASASSLPVRRMTPAYGSAAGATSYGNASCSAAAAAVASEDSVPLLLHEQLQREVLSLRASLKKAEAQLREREQKAVEMGRKLETAERCAASAVAASQRPPPLQVVRSTAAAASSPAAASQPANSTVGPAVASAAAVLAPAATPTATTPAATPAAATPAATTPTSPQQPSPPRVSSCCGSARAATVHRPSAAMALPVATVRRTSSSPPAASAQHSPPAPGTGSDPVPRSELASLVHGVPPSPAPPRPNVAAFYALRGKAATSYPITQTSPGSGGEAGGTASSAVAVVRPPGTTTSPDKFRGGSPTATRGIELPVQEPSAAEFAVAADADEAEIEAALARLAVVEKAAEAAELAEAAEAAEAAELAQAEAVAAEMEATARRAADARQLGRDIGRELLGEEDSAASPAPAPAPDPAVRRLASASEAFRLMDTNGNGRLGRAEVIKAARRDPSVRALLGLPATIRQEDGSRDRFEQVFQAMDQDDSKEVDFEEFSRFVAELQQAGEAGEEAVEAPAAEASPPATAGAAARAAAAAAAAARPPAAEPPAATPPNTQAIAMAQAMLRAASSGGGVAKLNQLVVARSPSCSVAQAPTSPASQPLNAGTAMTLKLEAASTSTDLALVSRPTKSPQPSCVATPRSGRSTPSEPQALALHQKASAQPGAFVHAVPDPNSRLLTERQSSFNRCLPPADTQRSAAAVQQDQLRNTGAVLVASPRRPENQLKPSSSAKKLLVKCNWRR